jgi:hypothetical protein
MKTTLLFWLLLLPPFFFISCAEENDAIEKEELFTLDIGRLEGELDLFNLEGARSEKKTTLLMRDGFFYIANGNGEKIVNYNSYGDLLFMVYNKETNPPPLTLREKPNAAETAASENPVTTRWVYPFPLHSPGELAVDSRKHIYVEDKLPPERQSYDSAEKVLLDSIVLHFDHDGRFLEYLGQEGRGGSPFPRIDGIFTTVDDELAVVCLLPKGRTVYWFDDTGALIYLLQFRNDALPVPENRDTTSPSLDRIVVSSDSKELYIKVDYYRDIYDESTNTRSGREQDRSVIWVWNIEEKAYQDSIDVPFYEYVSRVNGRNVSENLLYGMLGAMKDKKVFLYFPVEEGYAILIMEVTEGGRQRRGLIKIDNADLQYSAFNVSREGIISALLADSFSARLEWWRTDKLAAEMAE